MKKIVLDTNVYISALIFGGKPEEILVLAEIGLYTLIVSSAILPELQKHLSGKFGWPPGKIQEALDRIVSIAQLIMPQRVIAVCADPDDDKILECAVEGNADYIVSGDKHLLVLKQFEKIQIVKPADFLKGELWK